MLTDHNPTDEGLWRLLAEWVLVTPFDEFDWYLLSWLSDDPLRWWNLTYTRAQQDLDGDRTEEIILWANGPDLDTAAYLAIFVRRDGQWKTDIVIWDENAHYGSAAYADLRGLGQAQVVVDFDGTSGGTGILCETWTRSLIRCVGGHCTEIWQGKMAERNGQFTCGETYQLDVGRVSLQENCLVQESNGFRAEHPFPQEYTLCGPEHPTAITIQPRLEKTFCWDGQTYTLVGVKQTARGYVVQELVDGLAHESGYPLLWPDQSAIELGLGSIEEVDAFWGNPGLKPVAAAVGGSPGTPEERIAGIFDPNGPASCPLRIVSSGQRLAETEVPCAPGFSFLRWQDLVGNQDPELLIFSLNDWDKQTLNIYGWDTQSLEHIAIVSGTVTSSDLNAVRVEDLDGDGVMEILADYLPSDLRPYFGPEPRPPFPQNVYRWDGATYAKDESLAP